jgi:hypothetical protein
MTGLKNLEWNRPQVQTYTQFVHFLGPSSVSLVWHNNGWWDKLLEELLSFEHSYFQLPSCHGHNRPEYVMKFTSYTSQPFKTTYKCCGTATGYEVNPYHLSFCWNTKKMLFSSKTKVSQNLGYYHIISNCTKQEC